LNLTLDNDQACVTAGIPCENQTYGYINDNFYPIDGRGFGNYYNGHNYHFTFELHTRFSYQGGEVFTFRGDDDVWVFINNELAVDLGGVHKAEDSTIYLDNLGLSIGGNYPFDLFYNERHIVLSDLRLFTSIGLYCSYYDWCGVCQGNGQSCCTCNDNNLCTTEKCNITTGACIVTPVPCTASDYCHNAGCDPNSGSCTNTAINCDDNNVCTVDSCLPSSGCLHVQINCDDNNPCTADSCDPTLGCQHTSIPCDHCAPGIAPNCSRDDPCNPQECVPADGTCAVKPFNCSDDNACTIDVCVSDGSTPSCNYTAVNCDDGNACTVDSCDAIKGCQHSALSCDDGNPCTTETCDPNYGCEYANVTVTSTLCITAYCDPLQGVISQDVTCRPTSDCFCDPLLGCKCNDWWNSLTPTEQGLSVGAVSAIVIGSVLGIAILAFGGKKGYDYYSAEKMKDATVMDNPLYEHAKSEVNNPLYTSKDETAT